MSRSAHISEIQQNSGEYVHRRWYAAITRSRHEKKVAQYLLQKSLECFLPLCNVVHQWKNGRAIVQIPLFPGYVFARIHHTDMLRVLQTPGVVRFVSARGLPASIPDQELEAVRTVVTSPLKAELHHFLVSGSRVRIRSGPLEGVEGILLSQQGSSRVILSVTSIMRSVSVVVAAQDIEAAQVLEACPESYLSSQGESPSSNVGNELARCWPMLDSVDATVPSQIKWSNK